MYSIRRVFYCPLSAGSALVETLIALPVLLLLVMGAVQWGLIYQAKATLNHATFQGARLGALEHATESAIRRGLARGLLPLYSPDSSYSGALRTFHGKVMPDLLTAARIRIINPTREAFDDFGQTVKGRRELPNERLYRASTAIGAKSGVNLQDANLLKVEVTYGYPLHTPFVGPLISTLGVRLPGLTAFERAQYTVGRIPIVSTAMVRMQSRAYRNGVMISLTGEPELPRSTTGPDPDPVGSGDDPGGSGEDDPGDGSGDGGDEGLGDGTDDGLGDGGDDGSEGGGGDDLPPISGDPGDGTPPCSTPVSFTGTTTGLSSVSVHNPVNITNGNNNQREDNLVGLPGDLPMVFVRDYNSRSKVFGPLGFG
ncbi:MAG: pilus assembly protein [Candidatus Thiodiazotropha sp. (ex Monitilora ramsayi)]|nr:pilus assembly protein [Candidatus Thiodiazotropha sp. (ex Monitilora ramsayi)]